MIHLNLQFPSLAHLNRFFANPLDYSPEGVVPTPIRVEAPNDAVFVAEPAKGPEVQKRGPGRPKKVQNTNDAQPAVACNPGSPSPSQPATESPPTGSDGAVIDAAGSDADPILPGPLASPAALDPVKTIDLDAVRLALSDYSMKHGMEKARELLKKFGAARISELGADRWESFVAEASL